jgi:antirestriction protein
MAAIGCLGCYNDGLGNWKWLAPNEAKDLHASGLAVTAHYADGHPFQQCHVCGGDEFWCFDVEGLIRCCEMNVGDFVRSAEIAVAVHSHPDADALLAFLDNGHLIGEESDIKDFDDAFIGTWESAEEYVKDFLEDTGLLSEVPDFLRYYIDIKKLTSDMLIENIYTIESEDGKHWVFHYI